MEVVEDDVVKPDRIGLLTPEAMQVREWRPPGPKQKKLKMRIFSLQQWIAEQHRFVEEEEIIRKAMLSYNVNRETAREYVKIVVDQFKRVGVPVVDQS